MQLYEIVSLNGYDDRDITAIMRSKDDIDAIGKTLISYMSQWDYGERGDITTDKEAKRDKMAEYFDNGEHFVVWSDRVDPWAVLYEIIK